MLFSRGQRTRRRGDRGNLAVVTGLIAVPVAMIVVITIEMVSLSSEKARMQAAVDAAALAGARELAVAGGSARNANGFAETFAMNQVSDLSPRIAMTFNASQNSNGGFQVNGVGLRGSFFGNMVPPGGFRIEVSATAEALNQQPLCILALPENEGDDELVGLSASNNSGVQANNCLVHSNGSMATKNRATITAGTIQASRSAIGTGFTPAANNGALRVADPFRSRSIKRMNACAGTPMVNFVVSGTMNVTLPAGVHKRNVLVWGNGTLTLGPGEHYFCYDFTVRGNGTLRGDNVVMIFDEEETFHATESSTISLTGRTTGDWAGFVIVTTRDNEEDMEISSSFVDRLLGTIYLPNAQLLINAAGSVAEDSKWSVVVAKDIILDRNARLVINTDYVGSGVPVPIGVGDKKLNGNGTRLRQ
ncbi:pilus assembly protein TadG-related protein [Aquidulcibacter paucihalophilus]|uniref:pilus assembly protein TadG-related protein n=1 Tax=Aquidulcibacter paucihalophilus TaxID=1978549 RepID=UPI002FCCE5C4